MQLYDKVSKCYGCGACTAACPQHAIEMNMDTEGFLYPIIDSTQCIDCGTCERICPAKVQPSHCEGNFFALRCKDMDLLQKSSSGGAFSLLADEMIKQGGLVCGACFDKDFRVHHVLAQDIEPMRKSKYVQSELKDCFEPLRTELDRGRPVLFCGTPCQCHAVKRYVGVNREGLVLVSLICRGVQSPGLWADYAAWLSKEGKLETFDFRDKRRRNDGHTVAWSVNGKESAVSMDQDGFMRLYNRCLAYRPSCYACPYCNAEVDFDFSIGDFWGIEKIYPELADGMGTSLVIARGNQAMELLKRLSDKADIYSCTKEEVKQPALISPAKQTILRKLLMKDFACKDADGHSDIPMILKKYAGV